MTDWIPPSRRNLSPMVFLPSEDLHLALQAPNKSELFVSGYFDHDLNQVMVFKGDGTSTTIPAEIFVSNTKFSPDFTKFDIVDGGATLSFGDYKASAKFILRALDPSNYKCDEYEVRFREGKKVLN